MTDKKPPQSRKLVAQKIGPVDKRRRPRGLTRAVRIAIDAIIGDRCTRDEACKRAGITERALYLALAKPEVARYWNDAVHVLRNGERAANLFALIDVRDNSGNAMAQVSAAKALELVPEHEAAARGQQVMPGLQIVIIQPGGQHVRTIGPDPIDVTPNDDTPEIDNHGVESHISLTYGCKSTVILACDHLHRQTGKHMGSQSAKSEWQPAVIGTGPPAIGTRPDPRKVLARARIQPRPKNGSNSIRVCPGARAAASRSDGWSHGVTSILRSVPCEGRGVSFEFARAAGNSRTRPTPETSRPFLIFPLKTSGARDE